MKPKHDAKSQAAQILKWLQRGKTLTAIQALEKWGCFRLSARINDLRNEGHHIYSLPSIRNGKRVAQYSL